MKWKGRRQSRNIEDRRGMRSRVPVSGKAGGLGIGGILIIIVIQVNQERGPRVVQIVHLRGIGSFPDRSIPILNKKMVWHAARLTNIRIR